VAVVAVVVPVRVGGMARAVEIYTPKLQILQKGKDATLQQEWQIVDGGNSRYEWRNVPIVREGAGRNPERATEEDAS
jgi:hypothetical protein